MLTRVLAIILFAGSPDALQSLTFGDLERIFPKAGDITDFEIGDLDGDADEDVVLLDSDGGLHMLLQVPAGRFEWDSSIPGPTVFDADVIELFDADTDGDLDVYRGNFEQDDLFLNDGTGQFSGATHLLPVDDRVCVFAVAGDVDLDGDQDLLVQNGPAKLYRNEGAAGFAEEPSDVAGNGVALGDVDGDGDLDALVAVEGSCDPIYGGCSAGRPKLALNDGTGAFTAQDLPGSSWSDQVVLGDLDLDGDLDAFFPSQRGIFTPPLLLRNDGGGVFTEVSAALPYIAPHGGGAALLDADGDGDLDLYANGSKINLENGALLEHLFLNEGGFVFTDGSHLLPGDPCCMRGPVDVGDLDADGDADLLIAGGDFESADDRDWVRVYLNAVDGTFVDVTPLEEAEKGVLTSLALADLDGDGEVEGVRASGTDLSVLENDGAGDLIPGPAIFVHPTDEFTDVELGDVDGDGDLDAFATVSTWTPANVLLLAESGGSWVDASANLPDLVSYASSVLLADFDGDADLDAVLTSDFFCCWGDRLLENDGSGSFTEDPAFGSGQQTFDAVAADFDLDGELDVATASEDSALLLNEGGAWESYLFSTNGRSIDAGDVDGDGDPDIVFGRYGSPGIVVFWGDGAGGFVEETLQHPSGGDLELVDLDGDADLDLLVGWTQTVLENVAGDFVDVSPPSIGEQASWDAEAADLDQDGDVDVVFDGAQVLFNTTRHAAWATAPGLGRPFELDIYSEPSSPWVLVRSLGTYQLAVAPFGMLKLDPFSLAISGSGVVGPDGRGVYATTIPTQPGLAGVEIHWQAVVGNPPLLTNRTSATLHDLE